MLSSLETYRFYTRDVAATRARISEDTVVARETEYYKKNISTVSTVEEFLDDDRLYNHTMKAFGLEEMTYAKGLIRQVLESDLGDSDSYANRLEDVRYKNLAEAFDFGKTVVTLEVQTEDQQDSLIETYTATIRDLDVGLREDYLYFKAVMEQSTSVDDIFQNTRVRDYIFKTFDIDPSNFDYDTLYGVLTSDADDENSFVRATYDPQIVEWRNTIVTLQAERAEGNLTRAESTSLTSKIAHYFKAIDKADAYVELASMFNFQTDGSLDVNGKAQTDDQISSMEEKIFLSQERLTISGAQLNKAHYEESVSTFTSVNDLVYDARIREVLIASFNLPPETTSTELTLALIADPDDEDSVLNDMRYGFTDLSKAFNFDADGNIPDGSVIQSVENIATTGNNYLINFDAVNLEKDVEDGNRFKRFIGLTRNLDDFLSSVSAAVIIREYALAAHGISPDEVNDFTLKKMFKSDPTDPNNFVRSYGDERFEKLVKSFNFNEDGTIGSPRFAQTENEVIRMTKAYYVEKTRFDSSDATVDATEEEVAYYRAALAKVETVDEFVSDPKLVQFVAESEGMDQADLDAETLKKLFLSDMDDPESFANIQTDVRLTKIAGSYNFGPSGFIEATGVDYIQTIRGLVETENFFITQTIEEEAGADSTGARLAMYFERTAPTITSYYELLADQALGDFIRTALFIPAETASSAIDAQVNLLERSIDLEDLRDPEKLDLLVQRFLAIYDIENNSYDPLLAAFSGSTSISAETLTRLL